MSVNAEHPEGMASYQPLGLRGTSHPGEKSRKNPNPEKGPLRWRRASAIESPSPNAVKPLGRVRGTFILEDQILAGAGNEWKARPTSPIGGLLIFQFISAATLRRQNKH